MKKTGCKTVKDGRFVCCRVLGRGGEGTVYLAWDTERSGYAALKEYPVCPETAERIEKEALRLKVLSHEGIPAFHALFRENGRLYLAMEYIDGKSLKTLLEKKGPPGEKEVLRIASELCTLLEYLHTRSPAVYYPDLKPSNILLDREGSVHLIDFGAETAHTRGYAAPEQYLSDAAPDTRTDLYALGVTLHYLLTGKNPNHPPFCFERVNKLNPKITIETTSLVEKLLQPSRERRWQNAGEVKKAIGGIGYHHMRRRIMRTCLAVAAGVCVFAGVTGIKGYQPEISADAQMLEVQTAEQEKGKEPQRILAFSLPEGSYEGYQLLTISYDPLYGSVYYTTDGSEPGRESFPYRDGIVLSAPMETIRVCQLGLDGECTEIQGDYRITKAVERVAVSPDRPVVWDIYYALGKSWTEPVLNYELARIRELPAGEIQEEDKWLLNYMPFLRK